MSYQDREIKGRPLLGEGLITCNVQGSVRVGNDELSRYLIEHGVRTGTGKLPTAEKLAEITGIHSRQRMQPLGEKIRPLSETIPALSSVLAHMALDRRGWKAKDTDLLTVATTYPFGMDIAQDTADRMGGNTKTHTIFAACAGGAYALVHAFEEFRGAKRAKLLAIAAEHYSANLGPDLNQTIFGDGGAAVAVEVGEEGDILPLAWDYCYEPDDAIRAPIKRDQVPPNATHFEVPESERYFEMDGSKVLRWVVNGRPAQMIKEVYQKSVRGDEDVHLLVHLGSRVVVGKLSEKLMAEGVVATVHSDSLENNGNLAAASVYTELSYALSKLKKGSIVILAGFGAGLVTAVVAYRLLKNPKIR